MKYGIHVNGDKILAVSQFRDNVIPAEFTQITRETYENFISIYNPWQKWNATLGDMEEDTVAKDAYAAFVASEEYYVKLQKLKTDLLIAIDLGVQTQIDALQNEYDAVKNDYLQSTGQAQ